jgi:hypothetical protein
MRAGAAPQLSVEFDQIEAGPVAARGVSAVLVLRDAGAAELRVFASRVTLSAATVLDRLEIVCADGVLEAGRILCADGAFSADHPVLGAISGRASFDYDRGAEALKIAVDPVSLGAAVVEGALQRSRNAWQVEFAGQNLPLVVIREFLAAFGFWPEEYSDPSGKLDLAVRARGNGDAVAHAEGVIRADGVGILGPNSAENLDLESTFALESGKNVAIRLDARMSAGLLYFEPGFELRGLRPGITLEAGRAAIQLGLDARWEPAERRLQLSRLDLDHPGIVEAHATADLQLADPWTVHAADVSLAGAVVGPLYTTYLQPFLLGTQFSALEIAGTLDASASVRDQGLRELDLGIHDLHAYDGNGRFSVAGLDGALRVTSGEVAVASTLAWQGAGVHRLNLGPGELALSSFRGAVEVVSWKDVPILDGGLHIESLGVRDAGRPEMTVLLDGELRPISMADLTQALGWPVMSGTLAGRIDGLRWSRGRLEIGGRIEVALFDGLVAVRNLRIDDLFGTVPVLRADVDVHDIDLGQLTDRFSFGRIEGRLGGKVHALELQAWRPVYFEAELATPEDDRTRHRISQRAVDNLGFIGGGATAALSSGLLRYFKEYSYGRLGVSCRLYNGACELGGVEKTADGFLILTRGGVLPPWIEVRGTGRSIDWYDLVEGLKRIASEPPEIR